jgi:hypothetical protein
MTQHGSQGVPLAFLWRLRRSESMQRRTYYQVGAILTGESMA